MPLILYKNLGITVRVAVVFSICDFAGKFWLLGLIFAGIRMAGHLPIPNLSVQLDSLQNRPHHIVKSSGLRKISRKIYIKLHLTLILKT